MTMVDTPQKPTDTLSTIPQMSSDMNSNPKSLGIDGASHCSPKPVTMPSKRQTKLTQMLWHSLMEAKGEIVAVSTTSGDTYSGILFAIEPDSQHHTDSDPNTTTPNGIKTNNGSNGTNSSTMNSTESIPQMNKIVLKYVQKMSDPNANPADRIKAEIEEEVIIPASEFAALSAVSITDHSNSYRRADRQAFNDASGRSMHRKERELVRWQAADDGDESGLLEEEEPGSEPYDQFKVNNVDTTFDESMYTSNLDKSHPEYERMHKEAAEKEAEIMSKEATNKHVQDDRAYYHLQRKKGQNGQKGSPSKVTGDEDEEDAFSRVLGGSNNCKSSNSSNSCSETSEDTLPPSGSGSCPPPSKSSGKHRDRKPGAYVPPHQRKKLQSTKTQKSTEKGSIRSLQV